MPDLTLAEVARQVGVSPATLRRWAGDGLVALPNGEWTAAALADARIVARLRARGHSMEEIRAASESGRLAYGYMEGLFPPASPGWTLDEAAAECGLEPALVQRLWAAAGFAGLDGTEREISEDDLQLLRYITAVLAAGFPLVALLQLVRVYGQALARIADAEIKLFHLYVHEPLIREGVDNLEMADEMEGLTRELLPLASPIMDHIHQRFLQHFVEQDVVGHMELEGGGAVDLGRLRVAIAFADLAGYVRLTEEAGEKEAVDLVERFVESVESSLPEDARVVKTIGDEVMIVASDPASLLDWAVGFQALQTQRPLPRIGIHQGLTLYRDGDYFGREVNLAARVGARAAGGEVLVTRQLVEAAGSQLEFERIGEVQLKGFSTSTELFLARLTSPGKRTPQKASR